MSISKPSRRADVRQAKYSGRNTVNMPVDLDAFDAVIAQLDQDVQAAVRPAAQAGAEVIYQAVLRNVDAIGSVTGNLRNSIYQAFSKDQSAQVAGGYSAATYHVSWNAKKAPHGHLLEYGHIQKYKVYIGRDGNWYTNKAAPLPEPKQVAARPFMRPAFYRQGEAAAAVEKKFWEVLNAVRG